MVNKNADNDRKIVITNIAVMSEDSILINGNYQHQPSKFHSKIKLNDIEAWVEGTNQKLNCKLHCRLDRCEMASDIIIEIFDAKKEDIIGKRLVCIIYRRDEKLTLKYNKKTEPIIFPFEEIKKDGYSKDKSVFISTFAVKVNTRIEEWIKYNLKLGFDGIVIFHHDPYNVDPNLHKITDKYKNVYIIDFKYTCCAGHWRNIQRVALTVGLSGLRRFTKWVSLIDVDEFIYINKYKNNNIKLFLNDYADIKNDIRMQSRIITNKQGKGFSDIKYNYLNHARYVGCMKYHKLLFKSENYKGVFYITTPHDSHYKLTLRTDEIIHYHLWANERYEYKPNMPRFDGLYNFLYN